jgi:hypothetical protein
VLDVQMMGSEPTDPHLFSNGSDNRSQSEYFRKSRKAAHILRQVFHSQTCQGQCGIKVCVYTSQLLVHMASCTNSTSCAYSGCLTTKRLMQHYEQCQSRAGDALMAEPVVARPLPTFDNLSSKDGGLANIRVPPNPSTSVGRKFCLICALATSSGGEYSLESNGSSKESPSAMFDTPTPGSSLSEHSNAMMIMQNNMADRYTDLTANETKATFSVHFNDDSHSSLSRAKASSSSFGWVRDQPDECTNELKRTRRHSMDSVELLAQREDAECIQMITTSGPNTPEMNKVSENINELSNASIVIVRDVSALRNYSVSWA